MSKTQQKLKVKALGQRIQLSIEEPKAGELDMTGINAAKEVGTVIGLGKDVTLPIKVGDKVLFKAWAVDIITENGQKFYFISQHTDGICGVIV